MSALSVGSQHTQN